MSDTAKKPALHNGHIDIEGQQIQAIIHLSKASSLTGDSELIAEIENILETETKINGDALQALIRKIAGEVAVRFHANNEPSEFRTFTEKQAAEILQVGVNTLTEERHRGRISASQISNNRIRYTLDDIREYLRSRPYKPTEKQRERYQ